MTRILTDARLKQIAEARIADPDALGPTLAELIIDGNVPVEVVAELLSVSDVTIYRWMYGEARPRDADKIIKIKRLITILRKAKRAKDLPLAGTVKERCKAMQRVVRTHKPQPKPIAA